MKATALAALLLATSSLTALSAQAAELSVASGDTGNGIAFLRAQLDRFEEKTGHKVTIVPMPSSTSDQFAPVSPLARRRQCRHRRLHDRRDLGAAACRSVRRSDRSGQGRTGAMFPSIVESQTVDGTLVACPPIPTLRRSSTARTLLEKYMDKSRADDLG
jgi:trehalose/maltose transport system substrate-binding protein